MMSTRRKVKIGETYGFIKVLSTAERPYRCYNCECLKCGRDFIAKGDRVFTYSKTGCGKCRIKQDKEKEYAQYIGTIFGNVKILEYVGMKPTCKNPKNLFATMKCKCLKCGNIFEVPLGRLKQGGANQCKQCSDEKNLKIGNDISRDMCVDGTALFAIDGRRKLNKNSTTGIKGVSYMKKYKKYRAYIHFRHKQYNLGLYKTKEEAEKARQKAEREIYGNFLEWYAKEFPDKWEKYYKKNNIE